MRFKAFLTTLASSLLFFTACDLNQVNSFLQGDNQIVSFTFSFVDGTTAVGVIDNSAHTISVSVPQGTDLTSLTPTIIVSLGATVTPASGVAQNFSSPVAYTVIGTSGSTAQYVVTVTANGTGGSGGTGGTGTDPNQPAGTPENLQGYLDSNLTLKDKGIAIDYVITNWYEVRNNAVLTIEPGVCIGFASTSGELTIQNGSTIKAIGTSALPIQFKGYGNNAGTAKGAWDYVSIESTSDNELQYVQFLSGGKNSSYGVLRLNGNLKMSNCLIEGSLGYGLTTSASSTFSLFANNVIKSCDQTPIKLGNFRQAGSFDSTSSLTGNSNEYILISSGYVDENVTVKPASVPYFCDSWVVIRNQRVLNINAGAKFYMNSDAYLEVTDGATIKMLGNSSNRIQFMGSPNSSGKGAWKYISVGTNNDNRMEYVDFINGGKETSYGVIRLSGTLSMNNCKISGSKANGFYTSSAATLTEFNGNVIDGCNACPVWLSNISQTSAIDSSSTLTGNTDDYIGIGAGYCDVASEMKGTSVPYMLDNWIVLRKGRFTIGAGATVYLKESAYMQTTDQGILDIQGTASSPVKFTRLPGTAYYWKNIEIGESNGSKIENCTFEYGGNSYGLLDVSSNRTLTLKDCTFKDSKNYGVYMSSGSTVSHSGTINFSNCASGNVRLPNGTVSTTLP